VPFGQIYARGEKREAVKMEAGKLGSQEAGKNSALRADRCPRLKEGS
jgi:hypothetical protein